MIKLVIPEEKYLQSYMEAYDEFQAMGVSTYGLTDARSCDIFEKMENYRLERNLKPDRVGAHYFWLVDDETCYFIGEVSVRHKLNGTLRLVGGHIGYCVRYSEWGKGYATLMLELAQAEAKKLGISKALVTCDDTILASARVIEKNGFQLRDKICVETTLIRRYWKTL